MPHPEAQTPLEANTTTKLPYSNITKWPFILSDVILVIISMVLAFSNGGPLSVQAFGCCIFGVALGSGIAVMPFILDHVLNAKTQAFEHHLKNKESFWLALETELTNNQKSNFKRIKELEAKLQAGSNESPVAQEPITVDFISTPKSPTKQVMGPASNLIKPLPNKEAEPKVVATNTLPSGKKTPLLTKAIAQSQKNNPSKTVQRIIGSLAQEPAES